MIGCQKVHGLSGTVLSSGYIAMVKGFGFWIKFDG
jgi:hypothetical protein